MAHSLQSQSVNYVSEKPYAIGPCGSTEVDEVKPPGVGVVNTFFVTNGTVGFSKLERLSVKSF